MRAKGTTGQLPMASTREWRDFNPDLNTARYTPFAQHPQVVDQPVLTSWNNRQAPGYAGADSNLFSSVFRSQMLDRQLALRLKGGHKLTLPEMVDAMEQAGTTDLRGMTSLPLALRVLGTPKDPALAGAVAKLKAWSASGTHRIDRDRNGAYDDADAVRIMDAWWPRLIDAMFTPVMGRHLLEQLEATYQIDNEPNNHGDHLGSAYQEGFYGYVLKDLKRVLHAPGRAEVRGRLLRARQAGRVPQGPDVLAEERPGREGDRHLPGRRGLQGGRPAVPRRRALPAPRRRHPAPDPVDQPADLPAGGRGSGQEPAIARVLATAARGSR